MKIVDKMENVFQVRMFKDRINVINKSVPNYQRVQCRKYCSMVMSLHINFCCEDVGPPIATPIAKGIMERSLYWYVGSLQILTNTYITALTTKQVAMKKLFAACLIEHISLLQTKVTYTKKTLVVQVIRRSIVQIVNKT